jgi:sulfate adenylyltransferase
MWSPSARELDDLEVLLLGGYAPVRGFLGPDDVAAVAQRGRLSDGTAWPV